MKAALPIDEPRPLTETELQLLRDCVTEEIDNEIWSLIQGNPPNPNIISIQTSDV